jgi:hypothetical protein
MNLKNIFNFHKKPELQQHNLISQVGAGVENESQPANKSNVIPLMTSPDLFQQYDADNEKIIKTLPAKSLINTTEIKSFFEINYYGLGRNNGSNFRTQDALELGKKSLVSKFQNILDGLLESEYSKINKLKNKMAEIEGLSLPMTQQFKQTCEHVEYEIGILKLQIALAETQKGWVLEALSRYHIGYMKGINDAINFEDLVY